MGKKAVRLYFKTILTIASLIVLGLSFYATYADKTTPASNLSIHYISLLFPFLTLFNFVLFLYWILRKKISAIIPLAGLILNSSYIFSTLGLNFNNSESEKRAISTVTYNVNYFSQGEMSHLPEIASAVLKYNPDLVCLQEVQPHPLFSLDEIKREFGDLPYSFIHIGDHSEIGMALFSKLPIIRAKKIKFEDSGNGIMWADLLFEEDTIRVLNIHLQTTGLSHINGGNAKHHLKSLGENFVKRAEQALFVRNLIDTTVYPVILCGDFNDIPQSYAYKTIIGSDLTDSFNESALGLGGTYRNTFGLVRIDYIIHSSDFKARRYKRDQSKLSDHCAIFSELEYQN